MYGPVSRVHAPPPHSQGGRDTWTYAYHIRIHIHIVYICTCTYYIHIHYLQYIYIYVYFRILTYYIYIHYYIHLSRIVTDLCGFSGAGLKITFWAKSDGFNDTVLVSKSWSFASFLHHFASYFWSFQMWLAPGKISDCSIFGRSLLFSPDQKNAASGCPGMYTHV
jgi:hypothetical protein